MAESENEHGSDPEAVARLLVLRLEGGGIEIPVSGSSMEGLIESDSMVKIIGSAKPRRGEVWAFTNDAGGIVVHRVRHIDEIEIICRGVGNRFDDSPVPRSRLIGRVTSAEGHGGIRSFGFGDRIRADLTFRLRKIARSTQRFLR